MWYFSMGYALTYLAIMNLAGLALVQFDRHRAAIKGRRVPELWLLLLGAFGGATAMWALMCATRHKIRYYKFKVGYPIMMAVHLVALVIVALHGPYFHVQLTIWIEYLIAGLAIINIFAAAITNLDKKHARRDMWRVPEHWLMLIAAVGGAFAMLLTMCVIHHKTRYLKFMLGLPLMLVAQVALLIWMFTDYCQFVVIVTF